MAGGQRGEGQRGEGQPADQRGEGQRADRSGRLVTILVAGALLLLGVTFALTQVVSVSDGTATGAARHKRDGVEIEVIGGHGLLRSGDVVLAVDGRPLVDRSLPEVRRGDVLTYTVRRDHRALDVDVRIGDYPVRSALDRHWPSLVLIGSVLFMGGYVFLRKPDDRAARALLLTGTLLACGATDWVFPLQVIDLGGGANWWIGIGAVLARILVWPVMLHFALVFPQPSRLLGRHRGVLALVYLFPLVPYAIESVVYRARAETPLSRVGAFVPTAAYVELVYPVAMLLAFAAAYRQAPDPRARARLRWVAGTFAAVAVVYLAFWKLPDLVSGHPWGPVRLHLLLFSLCPVAIGIAILRVQVFDIKVAARRSAVYAGLTASAVAIYVVTIALLGSVAEGRSRLIGLIAAGVVAVVISPLHQRLQRVVSHVLYGDRDDPYAIVARLGHHLEATPEPTELLPQLVATVAEALRLPYAAVELVRGGEVEEAASYGESLGARLVLPLTYRGELVGRLVVGERTVGEGFGPRDRKLLEELAGQIGTAVRAARLALDLQRSKERLVAAREEERRRIRRDLHDGIGPVLAATALQLQTARRLIGDDPATTASILGDLADHTQRAIVDIRRIVDDLRPASLDELGLVGAIEQYVSRFAGTRGAGSQAIELVLEAEGDFRPLPAAVEVAAFRIVCEAVTNAVRHGGGHRCDVRLCLSGSVEIDVVDDGGGLPPDYRAGIGLESMRERAAEVGGDFGIEPARGGGTRLWARLPLPLDVG